MSGDDYEDLGDDVTVLESMDGEAMVLLPDNAQMSVAAYRAMLDDQADRSERELAQPPARPRQRRAIANWMDLPPAQFRLALQRRKKNRDALLDWVRQAMVEGRDYGSIHFVKKANCEQMRTHGSCDDGSHYSKPSLWKAGAEKVCGMLGLKPRWPNLLDELRSIKEGSHIITLQCQLLDAGTQVIGEGAGARDVGSDYKDFNKAIKMAKKSALIDAVLNTAGLSEIFTQDMGPDDSPEVTTSDASISEEDQRYLHAMASEYFGERGDDVLSSMARRRMQIADGDYRKIPAFRMMDAVNTLQEAKDFERSEKLAEQHGDRTDD